MINKKKSLDLGNHVSCRNCDNFIELYAKLSVDLNFSRINGFGVI